MWSEPTVHFILSLSVPHPTLHAHDNIQFEPLKLLVPKKPIISNSRRNEQTPDSLDSIVDIPSVTFRASLCSLHTVNYPNLLYTGGDFNAQRPRSNHMEIGG